MSNITDVIYSPNEKLAAGKLNLMVGSINTHDHYLAGGVATSLAALIAINLKISADGYAVYA